MKRAFWKKSSPVRQDWERDARGNYIGSLLVSFTPSTGRYHGWVNNFPWSEEGVGPLDFEGYVTPFEGIEPSKELLRELRIEGLEVCGTQWFDNPVGAYTLKVKYFGESLR